MDDTAPIVEEHHFAWNTLLQINENPCVKMMILPFGRRRDGTLLPQGGFFEETLFFKSEVKHNGFCTKMQLQEQYGNTLLRG